MDVTSTKDLQEAAAQVKSEIGFVNAVIANSGITGPTNGGLPESRKPTIAELQAHILKTPQADFTQTFAVNNTAMFYTMAAFLELLDAGNQSDKSPAKAQGIKSQFIATSSIGGLHRQNVAGFAYPSSKAGVNHLVKVMATYLVPHHIRCNVIAPGMYPSEMNSVGIYFLALRAAFKEINRGDWIGSKSDILAITDLCFVDFDGSRRKNERGCISAKCCPSYESRHSPGTSSRCPLYPIVNLQFGVSAATCLYRTNFGFQDMAGAILTLCGRGGAYYNGFVLVTDGGRLCILPG